MGLDVYVGSITRYLAGDWETVIQHYAREAGLGFHQAWRIVRFGEPAEADG